MVGLLEVLFYFGCWLVFSFSRDFGIAVLVYLGLFVETDIFEFYRSIGVRGFLVWMGF